MLELVSEEDELLADDRLLLISDELISELDMTGVLLLEAGWGLLFPPSSSEPAPPPQAVIIKLNVTIGKSLVMTFINGAVMFTSDAPIAISSESLQSG